MTDNINITGKLNSPPSTILRYGIAILTVVLVLGVKLLLEQFYDIKSPFLLFFTAVIISALFGGIRAGIFATILSAIISDYLFLSPSQLFFGEQSISQNIRLILFILEGVFISKIIDRLMSVNQEVLLRQQALQESQARYRSLIESVQDYAIFLLDVKGLVISWNQGAQNLKGYAAKEIIGQHFSCFYPQEDADRGNPDRYLQIAAVEGYIENEGWRIRKDGTRFWANAIITALRDEKGNLTGFCKLTRNLSEHRKTESETSSVIPESPEQVYSELEFRVQERTAQLTAINIELQQQIEERRKAEVALKQSEQRFRAIFNQTFQFIGLMQPNGILIEANETALKFGGLKREDAIDRPFWETRWWTLSPETQERLKQAIKEAANNQFIRYEVEVLGAGDTVRTIDFSIKPICDESGKVVLLIPEGRDISERKQAEAKIYQLNAELEQRVQQRTAQLEIEIAQQKQVQEALMQSEQRFRAAVDNIPDTFVIYDAERRLQFVNAEGLRRTQMPLKAFLGRRDEEIHPPEVTNGYLPYLLRTVETLTTQTFECTITLANYGTYTVIITYVPLLNEQGELYQILGITHDITQRKRAEEALRLSLERFRIALENSPIAVFNQDRELRYTWIYNPRLGYKAEEVLGKTDAELMHPEDAAKLTEIKQKVLLTGNGVREEVQASKIGEFSYYDLTVEPLQDDRGEIVGITAAAIDITDRKRTEAQLRIRAQQQAAIASLGQKALSGINLDELMKETTSLSAQILKVEYCEILELLPEKQQMIMRSAYGLPEELIGQSIVSTGLQSQAGYTLHASEPLIVSDLAAETRFTPSRFCQEYQIISGLSTIIAGVPQPFGVLQVHTTSKYSFTQDDIHFLQAGANILAEAIQRQKAKETLQQQSEELALANRLKDEFLATISHELRTPLNSMLGWAKLLPTRNFSPETVSKAIETISRNTKALAQLIEDVLDMSDIIRGRLNLQVEPVSLDLVIEQAIASINLAAEAKNIQICSHINDSVGLVMGDSTRLQQIVWNLLSNSVKFTPNGGKVEVRLTRINNQAQIQVSDTGRGISADFLPHVFDRFRQEDGSITRAYGGLGLGLAIVRYLVELHGGTIQAESSGYGKGATFTVLLPLV